MNDKSKICIVTSTRADWGLLSPLAHAINARTDAELQIIATNMHLLERYGHTVDEIAGEGLTVTATVEMPDTDDSPSSKAMAMSRCMAGMAMALARLRPDKLILLGDRYEMLAVASTAAVMQIPIIHIAGGEISQGAIDDNIRHAITKLSALHLTATADYRRRVIQMGEEPERVIDTGALGVWNITHQPLMTAAELSESLGFEVIPGKTLLVTYHPATLDDEDCGAQCQAMLDALDRYPEYRVVITYPNNDAGSEEIIRRITRYAAERRHRVCLIKSLGMRRYLSMLRYASAVIGNSSSGIVEVPSMGIPTVDIGIRQRGRIAAQSVIHCTGAMPEIARAIGLALTPAMQALASQRINPYGKDDTLDIMMRAIMDNDNLLRRPKKFNDL